MALDSELTHKSERGLSLENRARLWVLLAAVMWSTSGWFAKNTIFDQWPLETKGMLFSFWRSFFAGMLLLPLVRRPRLSLRMVPLSVTFVLMNFFYLSAMAWTSATNAIWIQNTAPIWVFLFGFLFLKEHPKRADMLLLLFGLLGVSLILAFELQNARPLGVGLALVSGITYAGVMVSLRLLRSEDSAWIVSANLLLTAVIAGAWLVVSGNWLWPDPKQLLLLAGFGILQMGLPYVFFSWGIRHVSSQEAAGIAMIEPILLPLWAAQFELPRWWSILGAAFILLGLSLRLFSAFVLQRHRQRLDHTE